MGAKDETISGIIHGRFGMTLEPPNGQEDNQTLKTILNHRSHRAFLNKSIPADLLEFLFTCAFSAPSKSDLQQVSLINLVDPAQKSAVAALVPQFSWAADAPAFLVFCGDNRRIRKVCKIRGHPFKNDHLDSFMNASVDASIAMTNLIHAASSIGLGCCPVSMIRDRIYELQEILQLPKWVFPVAGLALGYPEISGEISPRLPLSVTVHKDRYDDHNLENEINRYDQRRHEEKPFSQTRQRHSEEYGLADFYGWSEDKARQYSKSQRADFGQYIRKQGFCLD